MEAEAVVPDVIDSVPPKSIQVTYENGKEVNQGNELTPTQVQNQPQVKFDTDPGSLYTLTMIDPDAPSRANPEFREILHWMVVNISGNDLNSGTTISGYIGSGPPKDSGLHRYIFLVYKQPGPVTCDEPRDTSNTAIHRRKFNMRNFAKKYNLGNPIAGNFYQAQYDDCVPLLHARLQRN